MKALSPPVKTAPSSGRRFDLCGSLVTQSFAPAAVTVIGTVTAGDVIVPSLTAKVNESLPTYPGALV